MNEEQAKAVAALICSLIDYFKNSKGLNDDDLWEDNVVSALIEVSKVMK